MQTLCCLVEPKAFPYHVFLNFAGKDTRYGFTDFLRHYLEKRGLRVFMDKWELREGDKLKTKLLKEIEDSKIYVVVLSKAYVYSDFCNWELVQIVRTCAMEPDCRRILTVFFHCSPSDLLESMAARKDSLEPERFNNWKNALSGVASGQFSSWHLKVANDKPEFEYIEEIVREVSKHVAFPIGLYPRIQKVMLYLGSESDDGVCLVGICGNPGIGKSTIAHGVYLYNAGKFDYYCFVDKVGVEEYLSETALVHLKRMLLSKIIGDKYTMFQNDDVGMTIIKRMLDRKKVFFVFEDVDNVKHLKAIIELTKWFGSGSKVIITSQHKCLLEDHGIKKIYHVEEFNDVEAYTLLSVKAFNSMDFKVSYLRVLERAMACASKNPFFLEVIGSYLAGKTVEEWKTALRQYESIPKEKTNMILQISFDSLEKSQQCVLIDIALDLKEQDLALVENKLCSKYGICQRKNLRVLLEKSLIKIDEHGQVTLHALTQDMVRHNVRQEDPDKHNRIQLFEENGNREVNLPQVIEACDSTELELQLSYQCCSSSSSLDVSLDPPLL